MGYSELDTDLLLLAANNLEHIAKERLREMTPEERCVLRQACSRLDEWINDVIFERHLRPREKTAAQ